MRRLFLILVALAIPLSARAAGEPVGGAALLLKASLTGKAAHSLAQADLAKAIGKDLVCLCGTCPKRLISDCECGWAVQNQNVLLNAVVAGKTKKEITDAYRKAYGEKVLALLPNEGFAMTAWALPYTVGALFLVAMFIVARRFLSKPVSHAAPSEQVAPAVTEDDDAREVLARELEDLD